MKAVLEVEGTFACNLESLPLQLQVLKAATEVPSTLVYKALEKEVKTVGMFKKGSVVVSVDVNADSFTVSDTIKVGVKVSVCGGGGGQGGVGVAVWGSRWWGGGGG